jgi:DNA-binding beta-propeller fold protein YncE
MNICKLTAFAIICFAANPLLADLVVLRSAVSRNAALRFRDANAQLATTMHADTEAFYGCTVGPDRCIYVTGNTLGYGGVYRFDPAGDLLGTFAGANLRTPGDLAFGPDGNLYVIGSTWPEHPSRGQVLRYDGQTGEFIDVLITSEAGMFSDIAFGRDGQLYVCGAEGIFRYDAATGASLGLLVPVGGRLTSPSAFTFGPDGHLYVCDRNSDSVLKFNARTGAPMKAFVPSGRGGLSAPAGLAFGRNGCLYVSSSENNRILRYNGRTGQFAGAFITSHPEVIRPGKLLYVPTPRARR